MAHGLEEEECCSVANTHSVEFFQHFTQVDQNPGESQEYYAQVVVVSGMGTRVVVVVVAAAVVEWQKVIEKKCSQ